MKRPVGHAAISVFALIFALFAAIATLNTGDLFVRAFLIVAMIAAVVAGWAVWHGRPNARKLVALWSIACAVLASAVYVYSRYFSLRTDDQSIASDGILAAMIVALCALYLERRPWVMNKTSG